jgi:hypothetical protein
MANSLISTYLVIGILIFIGALLILAQQLDVAISASLHFYSPMMSSTVGIPLSARYAGHPSGFLQYHWTTDYGTFVRWDPPDYIVTDLGRDAITTDGTIYWQYLPEIHGEEPGVVLLGLSVEDRRTGYVIASAEKTLTRGGVGYETGATADAGFFHRLAS